jgi:hypothetical protein
MVRTRAAAGDDGDDAFDVEEGTCLDLCHFDLLLALACRTRRRVYVLVETRKDT